jgi:quercetin dioxygenase-like cupin family protein
VPRVSQSVEPISESVLALERRALEGGAATTVSGDQADTFVYVASGSGSLALGEKTGALAARSAALVLAGEQAAVTAFEDGLELVVMSVGAGADRHAPMGRRQLITSLDDGDAQQATGSRSFQILFDATNGSTRATLFAGYIPPGKSPWHYHLYDEIVWVPSGPGRLHLGGGTESLGPGSAFRLRPREVHIVENGSATDEMTIIGLFTPAGSPSAAYLTPDVAAEYRFSG